METEVKPDQVKTGGQLAAAIAAANQKTKAAETRVKSQADAVGRLRTEIETKKGLLERISNRFDQCATQDDLQGAKDCQAEMATLEISLRGLQLKLTLAENQLAKAQEELRATQECEGELGRQRDTATQSEDLAREIESLEQMLLEKLRLDEELPRRIQGLRTCTFLSEENRRQAFGGAERLQAWMNGLRHVPLPHPKSVGHPAIK